MEWRRGCVLGQPGFRGTCDRDRSRRPKLRLEKQLGLSRAVKRKAETEAAHAMNLMEGLQVTRGPHPQPKAKLVQIQS